jgi:hypothetical protein
MNRKGASAEVDFACKWQEHAKPNHYPVFLKGNFKSE